MKNLIALVSIVLTLNNIAHAGGISDGMPLRNTLECVSLDANSELKKAVFQTNGFTEQMIFSFETLRTTAFAAEMRNLGSSRAALVPLRMAFRFDPVASFNLPLNGGKGTVTLKEVGIDLEDSELEVVNVNCRRL